MTFYEVINIVYGNKVTVRNDLPDYLRSLWPFLKVAQQTS